MFIHAEPKNGEILSDNEINAFLRFGSDYENNYYEIELPLKIIIRRYSYSIIPINWNGRKYGTSKFKIKEMQNRYIFTILYVWIEKILLRRDLKKS